jgi:DNA ligase-1
MITFATLLDRLAYTPARNAKLELLARYFAATPDPDRGWALAALTDGLPFSFPVRRTLAELIEPRVDPELYRLSRDYVGDTAETVALLWPEPLDATHRPAPPRLGDIVAELALIDRASLGQRLATWLDALDANGRWALLKLLTGAPRVGVSARLAKTALATWAVDGGRHPAGETAATMLEAIEEVWHGLAPPYRPLFDWLAGIAPRPDTAGAPVFRPPMLSHPLEEADLAALDPADFAIEWKWDGIRVQIASGRGATRLYSRTGEDIGQAFPDITEGWRAEGVFDGELLIVRDGEVSPFSDLQKRLNRRTVSPRMLAELPAHVRLYDALLIGEEDVRALSFAERRARLEAWHAAERPPRTDLSALIPITGKSDLLEIWRATRGNAIEGLMLKRRESPYLAGRPRGHWFKWKRAALTADCVLMYAQRGSGKRSSYHSDFTFGAWIERDGEEQLVPVGKAYFGFTDAELIELDRWVRNNTLERFGPVRRVAPMLVLEVAFDAIQRSPRHKSGIAMRFPRIHRIRWDKPAAEADRLATLERLIETP